jgi:hypothetical protein
MAQRQAADELPDLEQVAGSTTCTVGTDMTEATSATYAELGNSLVKLSTRPDYRSPSSLNNPLIWP